MYIPPSTSQEDNNLLAKPNVEATIHNIEYVHGIGNYYKIKLNTETRCTYEFNLYGDDKLSMGTIINNFIDKYEPDICREFNNLESGFKYKTVIYTSYKYTIKSLTFEPGLNICCSKELKEEIESFFINQGMHKHQQPAPNNIYWYYLNSEQRIQNETFNYNSNKVGKEHFIFYYCRCTTFFRNTSTHYFI